MAGQTEGDPTQDIQTKYNEFQKACKAILPKIDRKLVEDFIVSRRILILDQSIPLKSPQKKDWIQKK